MTNCYHGIWEQYLSPSFFLFLNFYFYFNGKWWTSSSSIWCLLLVEGNLGGFVFFYYYAPSVKIKKTHNFFMVITNNFGNWEVGNPIFYAMWLESSFYLFYLDLGFHQWQWRFYKDPIWSLEIFWLSMSKKFVHSVWHF